MTDGREEQEGRAETLLDTPSAPPAIAQQGDTEEQHQAQLLNKIGAGVVEPTRLGDKDPIEEADAPLGVGYEDRVAAFVDILGFTEIVRQSASAQDDGEMFRRIYSALDIRNDGLATIFAGEIDRPEMDPTQFDDRFHTFSDCIVISVKPEPLEIGLLVYIIFKICRRLLQSGFVSRGGIAKGKLFHTTSEHGSVAPMVFGPAYLHAYSLESTHAEGARVILSADLAKEIKDYKAAHPRDKLAKFFTAHIKIAPDGPSFVDLFADFPGNSFYPKDRDVTPEIKLIQEKICHALHQTSEKPSQFRKNAMLAREFNNAIDDACRHLRSGDLKQFKIPADVLPPAHRWHDSQS